MATAKKTAAAKTTKKPTVKKTNRTAKRATVKKTRLQQLTATSFRPASETDGFFTFRFTQQTLYWAILSLVILALGLWVVKLHIEVQEILDRIDQNEAISASLSIPIVKKN